MRIYRDKLVRSSLKKHRREAEKINKFGQGMETARGGEICELKIFYRVYVSNAGGKLE